MLSINTSQSRKKAKIFCFILGIIKSYRTDNGFDKGSTSGIRNVHPLELSLHKPILCRVAANTPVIRTKLQCSVQSKRRRYTNQIREESQKDVNKKLKHQNRTRVLRIETVELASIKSSKRGEQEHTWIRA